MSLEECKRLAKEKLEKDKELRKLMRHSRGVVDGEDVELYLSINPLDWPHKRWVVFVSAYGEISIKYFALKESAEGHFEALTQKHNLKELEQLESKPESLINLDFT